MNSAKFETTVAEAAATPVPRPLLGKRVELIALQTRAQRWNGGDGTCGSSSPVAV